MNEYSQSPALHINQLVMEDLFSLETQVMCSFATKISL